MRERKREWPDVHAVRPVADQLAHHWAPRRYYGAVRRSCVVSPSAVVRRHPKYRLGFAKPSDGLSGPVFSRRGADFRRRGRICADSASATSSRRAVLEPPGVWLTAAAGPPFWREVQRIAGTYTCLAPRPVEDPLQLAINAAPTAFAVGGLAIGSMSFWKLFFFRNMQSTTTHGNTRQHTVTHDNTRQHTKTHENTRHDSSNKTIL